MQKTKKAVNNTVKQDYPIFSQHNYKWMLMGLFLIFLGFVLMIGEDANTINGKYNPSYWNEDIFSFRRIRLAPTIVVIGFLVQVYAIVSTDKQHE